MEVSSLWRKIRAAENAVWDLLPSLPYSLAVGLGAALRDVRGRSTTTKLRQSIVVGKTKSRKTAFSECGPDPKSRHISPAQAFSRLNLSRNVI
jgi:hypothetical protein